MRNNSENSFKKERKMFRLLLKFLSKEIGVEKYMKLLKKRVNQEEVVQKEFLQNLAKKRKETLKLLEQKIFLYLKIIKMETLPQKRERTEQEEILKNNYLFPEEQDLKILKKKEDLALYIKVVSLLNKKIKKVVVENKEFSSLKNELKEGLGVLKKEIEDLALFFKKEEQIKELMNFEEEKLRSFEEKELRYLDFRKKEPQEENKEFKKLQEDFKELNFKIDKIQGDSWLIAPQKGLEQIYAKFNFFLKKEEFKKLRRFSSSIEEIVNYGQYKEEKKLAYFIEEQMKKINFRYFFDIILTVQKLEIKDYFIYNGIEVKTKIFLKDLLKIFLQFNFFKKNSFVLLKEILKENKQDPFLKIKKGLIETLRLDKKENYTSLVKIDEFHLNYIKRRIKKIFINIIMDQIFALKEKGINFPVFYNKKNEIIESKKLEKYISLFIFRIWSFLDINNTDFKKPEKEKIFYTFKNN